MNQAVRLIFTPDGFAVLQLGTYYETVLSGPEGVAAKIQRMVLTPDAWEEWLDNVLPYGPSDPTEPDFERDLVLAPADLLEGPLPGQPWPPLVVKVAQEYFALCMANTRKSDARAEAKGRDTVPAK